MTEVNRFEDIRQWAHARNIIRGATPEKQFVKLIEEVGELANGIAKSRLDEIMDGIGDAVVVLTVLAEQYDITIEHCIELAWNEIKDRKGRMVNGIFVKEADLP
jgi:NTP pyrophosphatase (non-canonical NTP hydrolase)